MTGLRGALIVVHVLSVIFWLGTDVVVFYMGFLARNRTAPIVLRREWVRLLATIDQWVMRSALVTLLSGIGLSFMNGGAEMLQQGWFQVKLALVLLIAALSVLLIRMAPGRHLMRAMDATEQNAPEAPALEDLSWQTRWQSRSVVLAIYASMVVIITLALLRPF